MTAPKPHKTPTADKDRDWNWSAEATEKMNALLDQGGWELVAQAHAWYDSSGGNTDPPEKKTAYKLPHHDLVGGDLKVVYHGVTHAMNIMAGGRGGVDLPEDEIDDVYEHLAEHYRQFDEEPPPLS